MRARVRRVGRLAAFVGIVVSTGAALMAQGIGTRPESLSGARAVRLVVPKATLPSSLASFDEAFRSLLQERMKTQGLPLQTEDRLMAALQDDGLVELVAELSIDEPVADESAYRLRLEAVQVVRLARNPAITARAVTWRWARDGKIDVTNSAGAASFLRDLSGFAIQQFVNDYRTANGK